MEKVVSDADLQAYPKTGAGFRDSEIDAIKQLVSKFLAHWLRPWLYNSEVNSYANTEVKGVCYESTNDLHQRRRR
ncbi:MAG: hypothetical protein AB7D06_10775 [Pedobacter sp.]